jgi:putative sterol carrier protein
MAAKQVKLLDVVRQFKDEAQELVKKTQSQVQELVVKTTNDIGKLAVNNPQIKNVVKRLEAEQKRYEKVFMDLQNRALKLYKDKAEMTVSDIKNKIEGYKKQAEKIYKEATKKKLTATKPSASRKIKVKSKTK